MEYPLEPAPPAVASALRIWLTRTGVPLIVGWLLQLPIAGPIAELLGVDTPAAEQYLTAAVTVLLAYLYATAVHLIERARPRFGWLLGKPAVIAYAVPQADGTHLVTDLPAAIVGEIAVAPAEAEHVLDLSTPAKHDVACPTPELHGNPFRYCPHCDWTENDG